MTTIVKKNQIVPAEIAQNIIKLTELKNSVTTQLDELKARLLEFTQKNDVYTLKTGEYTISRGKRQTVTVYDDLAVAQWLKDAGVGSMLVQKLSTESKKIVDEMVKAGTNIPDTHIETSEYIMVKQSKTQKAESLLK